MKAKSKVEKNLITGLLWVTLILNGGFFDESVAAIGALITVGLFWMLLKGETFLVRDKRIVFFVPTAVFVISMVVSFWSIDYIDNFMGAMRIGIICLWMWLLRCRKSTEVSDAKNAIPWMGGIIVLLSIACYYIPLLKPYFWENTRMCGAFQYANTTALLLALGILQVINEWKENPERKIQWHYIVLVIALMFGLLLTGSRSVLLLLIVWGIVYAVKTPEFRKIFLLGVVLVLLTGGLYTVITGNIGNVGRIFTIFSSNSTMWGRILYARDAVLLLTRKFYGLGRMGYYYSQGTFQSGVYDVRFVHNDFLQIALDYGVIALGLLLYFLIWQLLRGKQSLSDKGMILFICVASAMDFHCQYLYIVMVLCMFFDYGNCEKEKKKQLRENYILFPVFIVLFIYISIATACCRSGKPEITLSMLPDYTSAQEKCIFSDLRSQKVYELSNRLIQKNTYDVAAYIARGSFYASRLSVPQCIEDLDRMLELKPYRTDYYQQYELLLQDMKMQIESNVGDFEEKDQYLQMIQERIEELPLQLKEVEKRTSFLAYKIKDKPVFYYESGKNADIMVEH